MLTENMPPSALRRRRRRRRSNEGSLMGGTGAPHSNTVPAAPATSEQRGNTSVSLTSSSIESLFQISAVGSCTNPRTRPYYFRMCKKASSTHIDSLSDDILLEILLRVSAEDIHDRARFVCQRWKRIIHGDAFAYDHHHRTGYGLLFREWNCTIEGSSPVFVTATRGRVELSKLSCKLSSLNMSCCNGLLLDQDRLWILNPVTKARFNLPRLYGEVCIPSFRMSYAAAFMKYKVVVSYRCTPFLTKCAILTVGVDKTWRHVAVDKLSPQADFLILNHALTTEGFVHWVWLDNDVLTLNVETEVFTKTPAPLLPEEDQDNRRSYEYLSNGKHLTVLISCGDLLWEVWEMKGESGEWRKLMPNIDLRARKCRIPQLVLDDHASITPIGWIQYPEILALSSDRMDRSCITYNFDKDEIDSFKLPVSINGYNVEAHRNNLLWIS